MNLFYRSPGHRPLRLVVALLGLIQTLPAQAEKIQRESPAAAALISRLGLQLIPGEGAYFGVTYRSEDQVDPRTFSSRYPAVTAKRPVSGAIYALVTPTAFSAMHRLPTDEIWHFYSGTPIELLLLFPDGTGKTVILGPAVFHGEQPQYTVPHGVWMGGRPRESAGGEAYSFFGTTMAPAFAPDDFELGNRANLQKAYPRFVSLITALTRP